MSHPSPPIGKCLVCGRELSAERARVTEHPNGLHDNCRDWSTAEFPFRYDVTELRRIARLLITTYRAVVDVGQWLVAVERRWPNDAKDVVRQYETRKHALRERLVKAARMMKF